MRKGPFQRRAQARHPRLRCIQPRGSYPKFRTNQRRARKRRGRWYRARTCQHRPHMTRRQSVSMSRRMMHRRTANPARPLYPSRDRTQLLRRLNPRARRQPSRRRPHVLRMHIRQSADRSRSRRRRIRTCATPGRMRTEPRGIGPSGRPQCREVRRGGAWLCRRSCAMNTSASTT
jgi:hypothetical protein